MFTAALFLVGGGAAYAYWTISGSGSGSVSTAEDVSAVIVTQTSTIDDLAPGVAAQTLSGTFTNPNDGPVFITKVTASIDSVTKASGAPAGTCDATDYTLTDPVMPVGVQVASGTGQGSSTGATIAFNNKATTNQDACKGATVDLAYAAS